jgi:hypothetical protein
MMNMVMMFVSPVCDCQRRVAAGIRIARRTLVDLPVRTAIEREATDRRSGGVQI